MNFDFDKQEKLCRFFQGLFLIEGLSSLLIAYAVFSGNFLNTMLNQSFITNFLTILMGLTAIFVLIANSKLKVKKSIFSMAIYTFIYFFISQIFLTIMIIPRLPEAMANSLNSRNAYYELAKDVFFTPPGAIFCVLVGTIQLVIFFWSISDTKKSVHLVRPPKLPPNLNQ